MTLKRICVLQVELREFCPGRMVIQMVPDSEIDEIVHGRPFYASLGCQTLKCRVTGHDNHVECKDKQFKVKILSLNIPHCRYDFEVSWEWFEENRELLAVDPC